MNLFALFGEKAGQRAWNETTFEDFRPLNLLHIRASPHAVRRQLRQAAGRNIRNQGVPSIRAEEANGECFSVNAPLRTAESDAKRYGTPRARKRHR